MRLTRRFRKLLRIINLSQFLSGCAAIANSAWHRLIACRAKANGGNWSRSICPRRYVLLCRFFAQSVNDSRHFGFTVKGPFNSIQPFVDFLIRVIGGDVPQIARCFVERVDNRLRIAFQSVSLADLLNHLLCVVWQSHLEPLRHLLVTPRKMYVTALYVTCP